ncbi:unnamed protein product, partial [Ectocarpus sp. 12 AP-2014]
MGCSESKERLEPPGNASATANANDLRRRSEGEVGPMSPRMAAPALGESEPGEDRRRKTRAHRVKLFSTIPKTSYNTHTTASSYTGSNPRSDGGSDIGNISQHSSFSRRSGAGGFGGEECLEEVSSEESDFEDDEEQPSRSRKDRTKAGEGKFSLPPSPSGSVGGAMGKDPTPSSPPAEALAEAPVSTVQILSSREGTLSANRGSAVPPPVMGAKSAGTLSQPSPSTPRTEEASPSATSVLAVPIEQTPTRWAHRGGGGVGPFAFPPEAPMFVLPLTGLSAARSFPKYQNAMRSGALVPYDSLDRNSAFVVFVSHRWINESSRPTEFWKHGGGQDFGEGSPDVDSAKHTFLVEGLHSILASLPREVAVFLWIDYSCIDQENPESKRKGARSVAAYMQLSDAVFTPYAESLYPSSGGGGGEASRSFAWRITFANPLGEVCNAPWPNSYRSLQDFCSRAWCRLEVLLCATLPLRDGGFRYFAARGEEGRAQDRPHFVYGEYQRRRKLPPEALARSVDEAWARSLDPLEGFLSNSEDMEAIVHGMGPVRLASRSAASSALGSSVNTTTAVATMATPLHPGDSEERRRATSRASGERERERERESSDAGGRGSGGGGGGGRGQGASKGAGRGRTGRELIPPLSETRAMPGLSDEAELVSAARSIATDRLMSPAVKGGRIISSPSPMRKRTAAAGSAVGSEIRGARGDSSMPGWLWDTVFQYPLSEGD